MATYPRAPAVHATGVDLTFRDPAGAHVGDHVTGVDLTFGETAGNVDVGIVARIGLRASASVLVDAGVYRGLSAQAELPFGRRSADRRQAAQLAWQETLAARAEVVTPVVEAERLTAARRLVFTGHVERAIVGTQMPWGAALAASYRGGLGWIETAPARRSTAMPWGTALAASTEAVAVYGHAPGHRMVTVLPFGRVALSASARAALVWGRHAAALAQAIVLPWGHGATLHAWGSGAHPMRGLARPMLIAPVVADLHFCAEYPEGGWVPSVVDLVFGVDPCGPTPGGVIVIPIRRTYVVHNSVFLYRLPAGTEFKAESFSLDVDVDSWTVTWSASLHSSARPHLQRSSPDQRVEVECVINGQHLHLVVDEIGRDRRFPEHRIQVSGRGRAAELADLSLTFGNAAARTAQQIMADVLTVNGVPLGWDIDWQIADWLVPADAWVFRGSYIDALKDIAGAAGAYLQPHLTDKVLRVLPRYPAAPWNWSTALTPDIELPVAATSVEGIREVIRPDYNRVFVGGIGKGYFGPVTRTGTAGDKVAPQVNHALITAPEAHWQRGLAELADTGLQEHVSIDTMLWPEAGIIMPGTVMRYVSDDLPRLGLVRKTGLQMQRWPELKQTLEVETHVV